MNNFVILAAQRSGSNMLAGALDKHDEIICRGELFRLKPAGNDDTLDVVEQLDPAFQASDYRRSHPQKYLEAVQRLDRGAGVWGFKLMFNQAEKANELVIPGSDYRKIFLFRRNLLAAYSSHLIAKKTHTGIVRVGEAAKKTKVKFRSGQFKNYCNRRNKNFDHVRAQLERHSANGFLEVEYLDICSAAGIRKVLEYIGVDSSAHSIAAGTVKRNTSRIVERFTNPGFVRTHLETIGHPEWEEESGADNLTALE